MRRIISWLLLLCLWIPLAGCADSDPYPRYIISDVTLDKEHSFFGHFELKGDNHVYFYCDLRLANPDSENRSVQLIGFFVEDAATGLLQERHLLASSSEDVTQKVFELQPGENSLRVVFRGTTAGYSRKQDRLLPEIVVVDA